MADDVRDGGTGAGPGVDEVFGRGAEVAGLADEILALRVRQTAMLDQIGELRVRLERSERLLDAVGSLWSELRLQEGTPTSSADGWLDLAEADRLVDGAGDLQEAVRAVARFVFGDDVDMGVGVCCVEDERTLRIAANHGFKRANIDAFLLMDLDERLPPCDALRTGAPVWVRDRHDLGLRYPHTTVPDSRYQSMAAVPLVNEGEHVGVFAAWFPYPQAFDVTSRAYLLALAERFAILVAGPDDDRSTG